MSEKLIYYKRNVNYVVGGRYHLNDRRGWSMTGENPYVAIEEPRLRDFKVANKYAITRGLIVEVEEPSLDWDTSNVITDEQAAELVKNMFGLKKKLAEIDVGEPLYKLLQEARDQQRSQKIIQLIEDRITEVVGEIPTQMRGVV